LLEKSVSHGVDFIDVRGQYYRYELIVVDNGVLREYSVSVKLGIGIRVLVDGFEGYASTNDLVTGSLDKLIDRAVSIARASRLRGKRVSLYERGVVRDKVVSRYSKDFLNIDPDEKLAVVMDAYRGGRSVDGVVSVMARLGLEYDHRIYASSKGDHVEVTTRLVGLGVYSVARHGDVMESIWDSRSMVAGWEYIGVRDWYEFARDVSRLAVEASKAPVVKPGVYQAVLDNEIVGLMLHEAFGHATEADIVESRDSVLYGRIGEKVASELVTIVDDGLVEGGYYVPYDDEGTRKRRVATVENGVLKTYLHSRSTPSTLGGEPTGNARAMDYQSIPLVRQTNTYMLPGDYGVEELFEDIRYGLYIRGRGAKGGEVSTSTGTFTFTAGPSYIIENGEVKGLVRGVMLSGNILETLKGVDAVARDLKVRTSVFGGCGKGGQLVRVGDGGPHVRVKAITIGG